MVMAFECGARSVIPVASLEDAEDYKAKGYLVAGEREGIRLGFADFGNDPLEFRKANLAGADLVYTTTNGTQAIQAAQDLRMAGKAVNILIGSFLNLSAIAKFALSDDRNLVILCAGWKNSFSLEDAAFAGALCSALLSEGGFQTNCDSVSASLVIWNEARKDTGRFLSKAAHFKRLEKLGLGDSASYCLTLDVSSKVPLLQGDRFIL
jgi:2-phosphosulfolactate phosphatase